MLAKRAPHPCTRCQIRKVKCDRLLPACSGCVARNETDKCLYEPSSKKAKLSTTDNLIDPKLSQLWDLYEKIWLYQSIGQIDPVLNDGLYPDLSSSKELRQICFELITEDASFKIFDYSMERLGALYFGLFSDIGEVYTQLAQIWETREEAHSLNSDDRMWSIIIWSILTTTIYFMPLNALSLLVEPSLVHQHLLGPTEGTVTWSAELQYEFFELCLKYTIAQLSEIMNIIRPNIKVIQCFLVLCNTSFSIEFPTLGNNILVNCINLAKVLRLSEMRLKTNESTSVRLVKLVSQKIWFRLSVIDYLRSSPMKIVSLHKENTSTVNQSLLLQYNDPTNVDVYDAEDTWESLYWKIVSLERDLNESKVPSIKMLQSIRKCVDIFEGRLKSLQTEESYSSKVEYFVTKVYLEFVLWKTMKFEFVHYNVSSGFEKLCGQTRHIIALFLINIRSNFHAMNRHFSCFHILSVVSGFHSYYSIFTDSHDNEELLLDCLEIIRTISPYFKRSGFLLYENLLRMYTMRNLWKKVKIVDMDDNLLHPVIHILKKDIAAFKMHINTVPKSLSNVDFPEEIKDSEEKIRMRMSKEFNSIVDEFLLNNPLILYVEQ